MSDLCGQVLTEVSDRIERLMGDVAAERREPTLLDVGCWDGGLSRRCGAALGAKRILGVEVYEGPAAAAEAAGMEIARIDLEAERLPWPDASVDVVVCNQVLEHLKNVWLPMTEMHRVLRRGGSAVLSVPNLASLHNRVLLALGRQPTSVRIFGPHVRGYTLREFCDLVGRADAYTVEVRRGAGFYPIPSPWSAPFSALWRGGSHTIIVVARKTGERSPWGDYVHQQAEEGVQTFYGVDLTPVS
jgi:SAM-dependent methyltransferase